jgi:N-acetylneuraminic acid mutarotase
MNSFAHSPFWQPRVALPAGNAGFAHAEVDGQLVIVGGTHWEGDVKQTLDSLLVLDAKGNRWLQISRLQRPFAYGVFAALGDSLYVLGGDDGTRTHANSFIVARDGTSRSFIALPHPLAYAGCVCHGSRLFILGGTKDIRDLDQLTGDFLSVDLTTGRRTRFSDFPGGRVMHAALAIIGDSLFVFPGGTFNVQQRQVQNTQATWRYSLTSGKWEPKATYPFPVRGLAACALDSFHVLVAGGYKTPTEPGATPSFTDECFLYDVVADRYRGLPPLPYAAMLIGLQKVGDSVYLIGGEDRDKHRVDAVYSASIAALLSVARG